MTKWYGTPLVQKDGLVLKPYLNFLEGLVLSQDTVGLQGLSHLPNRASRGKPADQHTYTCIYISVYMLMQPTRPYLFLFLHQFYICHMLHIAKHSSTPYTHTHIYIYTHTHTHIHTHVYIYICASETLESAVHLSQLSSRMLWSGGLPSLAPSAAVCKRYAPSFCLWESAFLHISSPGPSCGFNFLPLDSWMTVVSMSTWQGFEWVKFCSFHLSQKHMAGQN